MEDLRFLANSDTNVPSSDRHLEACLRCGLILAKEQWSKKTYRARSNQDCPNHCYEGNPADTTPFFTGIVSIMQPKSSWVARWNNKADLVPGVYAIHLENQNQ